MTINLPTSAFCSIPRLAAPIQTPYGILSAPGTRVGAYVRSTGVQDGDDDFIRANLVETLNAGLARCRSGLGDTVYVLPGHAEDISSADFMSSLVAGTNIVGIGEGANRPTFTWSAAGSTFLFDVANVSLQNCILEFAGDPTSTTALTVAAPITVSAAGCSIIGCQINTSVDADQLCTIGITTTAAANDFTLAGCQFYGATAGESTTLVQIVGGTRLVMTDCTLQAATSSTTVGVMRFLTTAPTNAHINRCFFLNRKALSVSAFTGIASGSGIVSDCGFGILDNATTAGLTTPGSLQMFRCYTANLAGENGALTTPVSV